MVADRPVAGQIFPAPVIVVGLVLVITEIDQILTYFPSTLFIGAELGHLIDHAFKLSVFSAFEIIINSSFQRFEIDDFPIVHQVLDHQQAINCVG